MVKYIPISPNDTLIVGKIVFSKNSTLQNNGTLIFNEANVISDFSISTNSNGDQGTISILNYGKIECKNCTLTNPDPTKETFYFENKGAITCKGNFTATIDSKTTYTSLCGSKTEAQNITFKGSAGLTYKGIYSAKIFTIDIAGGAPSTTVNIGSDCGDSKFEVEELLLKNNVTQININEKTRLDSIDISGINKNGSVEMHVDGILTLGKVITGGKSLFLTGIKNSAVMSLCYKPTGNNDFATKASSTYAGTVIYLQYNENSTSNTWSIGSSPKNEGEILGNFHEIPDNISSFKECLNGFNFASLLPIELTSFRAYDSQDAIRLEWEVATEKDMHNYSVEYSINGMDWDEIDVVDAMGTTSFATRYISNLANDFPHEFLYFRLKQVTLGGLGSYSQTIVFDNTTSNKSFKTLKVGPIDILYNDSERRYIEQ